MAGGVVTTIEMPWLALVRQADPGYDRARRHELDYEASSFGPTRRFHINPLTSGAYADTRQFLTDDSGNLITDELGFAILIDAEPATPVLGDENGNAIGTETGGVLGV